MRVDFSNSNTVVDRIAQELEGIDVCAFLAPDEKYVEIAAGVARKFKLPHNPMSSIKTSTNKYLARSALSESDFNVPEFWLIDFTKSIAEQTRGVQFPCVVKPIDLSGSRGVIRADNPHELHNAIGRVKNIIQSEHGETESPKILIERYISGTEHALEGYLTLGELETFCIFDKPDPLEGPYFEETCLVTPSRLNADLQEKIESTVRDACAVFGLEMGPVHAEVRVRDDEVWILEVAPRSIGGDCARLFELATNSSLEEYVLCRSAGRRVNPIEFTQASGVAMIPVTEGGILRRVEGVIDAQAIESVLEVQIDVRAGQKMIPWPEGSKYPGFIYSKASSADLVERSLHSALSCINFVCMPEFPLTVN